MASGDDILNLMVKYLGIPYKWAGDSPSGFDCSGLMQYVFRQAGISIPRTAASQAAGSAQRVAYKDARPGDLLYFREDSADPSRISHVAIYIGNGKMIEAARPGTAVRVSSVWPTPAMVNRYTAPGVGSNTATVKYAAGATYTNTGASMPGSGTPSQTADTLDMGQLAQQYNWSAAFLNSVPELQPWFKKAVAEGWTNSQFIAKVMTTRWWNDNSAAMRTNLALEKTDPASWKAKYASMAADITALASVEGAGLSAHGLDAVTRQALTLGLSQTQLRAVLAKYIAISKDGTIAGDAGTIADQIRQVAYQNGVKVSDEYVLAAARAVEGGTSSTQAATGHVRAMAASAFPQFADQIHGGMNLADIAAPYQQSMAATLEIDPAKLDLFDPTIRKALSGAPDPKTGVATPKTLWQFESDLKQDPRWMQTNNARESMESTGRKILSDFGVAW